jgi:DUF1680 family protein
MTQKTNYPYSNETLLRLKMDRTEKFVLALRVPAWAGAGTVVHVNGKPAKVTVQPGNWVEIERDWKDGDHVEFSLDMPLRLVPIDAKHENTVALLHGPLALFAIEPGTKMLTKAQLMAAQQVGLQSSEWEVASEHGRVRLKSFPSITNERYRLYHEV